MAIRWLIVLNGTMAGQLALSSCLLPLTHNMSTVVLRVSTDRVLEGSIESTSYESWHDSIMLYM